MNNCVMTRLGKCSYEETGCSDCRVIAICKEALEKQIPKKPKQLKGYEEYICSECSALVGYEELNHGGIDEIYHEYCPICGQRIDWSEVQDEID